MACTIGVSDLQLILQLMSIVTALTRAVADWLSLNETSETPIPTVYSWNSSRRWLAKP
jgi:hypothetical protein